MPFHSSDTEKIHVSRTMDIGDRLYVVEIVSDESWVTETIKFWNSEKIVHSRMYAINSEGVISYPPNFEKLGRYMDQFSGPANIQRIINRYFSYQKICPAGYTNGYELAGDNQCSGCGFACEKNKNGGQ